MQPDQPSIQPPVTPPSPQPPVVGDVPPVPQKRNHNKQLTIVMVIIVALLAVGLAIYVFAVLQSPKTTKTSSVAPVIQTATPASSIDDTSLSQDVTDINNDISKISQDDTTSGAGLDDQQNQIQVPTN